MSSWILLRHGESVGNRERWLAGSTDTPLTPLGQGQAKAAGWTLKDQHLARALSSTLSRARETAELVVGTRPVPLSLHPELQERSMGLWSTRDKDTVRREFGDALWSWDESPPEGESCGQVAARALDFLRSVEPVEGTTLVVCHGGVIRGLLGLIDDTPYAVIGRRRVPNAVPIVLDLGAGGWPAVWHRHAAELERLRP